MKKEKLDILYLGIPNVCFSSSNKKEDKIKPIYVKQRKERGFDDTEMWGLNVVIAEFILPRLKRFREIKISQNNIINPKTQIEKSLVKISNKKINILDKMIRSFELVIKDNKKDLNIEEQMEFEKGFKLFNKHFMELWD